MFGTLSWSCLQHRVGGSDSSVAYQYFILCAHGTMQNPCWLRNLRPPPPAQSFGLADWQYYLGTNPKGSTSAHEGCVLLRVRILVPKLLYNNIVFQG